MIKRSEHVRELKERTVWEIRYLFEREKNL